MAGASLDVGILPSPGEFASLAKTWGGWAVGMGTPGQQILSNLVIFVVALLSSAVSLGATLIIAFLAFIGLGFGILRLIPFVNRYWPLG